MTGRSDGCLGITDLRVVTPVVVTHVVEQRSNRGEGTATLGSTIAHRWE